MKTKDKFDLILWILIIGFAVYFIVISFWW